MRLSKRPARKGGMRTAHTVFVGEQPETGDNLGRNGSVVMLLYYILPSTQFVNGFGIIGPSSGMF
jgi:hypothetical protein